MREQLAVTVREKAGTNYLTIRQRVEQHRIGQVPRLQTRVMHQARQPLRGGFLMAKAAGQLGLTAGLLGDDCPHEIPDAFALMAMCPGQPLSDRIVETNRRRVLSSHIPRLA
jgi:hypothetical protein